MQINYIVGNCAQCKQEKTLPILRDEYLICQDCNQRLDESVQRGEVAKCFYCQYAYSRLWVKFNHLGNFICRACQPEEICSGCGRLDRISFISLNLCVECTEKMQDVDFIDNEFEN